MAKGSYGTATVTTSGAGATFITGGTIGRVTASASGVGRIVIDPTNREPAWERHTDGSPYVTASMHYPRNPTQWAMANTDLGVVR